MEHVLLKVKGKRQGCKPNSMNALSISTQLMSTHISLAKASHRTLSTLNGAGELTPLTER